MVERYLPGTLQSSCEFFFCEADHVIARRSAFQEITARTQPRWLGSGIAYSGTVGLHARSRLPSTQSSICAVTERENMPGYRPPCATRGSPIR